MTKRKVEVLSAEAQAGEKHFTVLSKPTNTQNEAIAANHQLSRVSLDGMVAVVTGAGGEIGRAISSELSKVGARVCASDADLKAARATAEVLRSGKVVAIEMDVTREKSISEALAKIEKDVGPVDILVNNAGVLTLSPLLELPEKDWDFVLNVNAKGVFLCSKHFGRQMAKRKRGVIVNIASVAAKVPLEDQIHYCASKAAVVAVTKVSSLELAPYGIRVNAVCPGAIDTEMFAKVVEHFTKKQRTSPKEVRDAILSNIGIRRLIRPAEIAKLVAFLCSDEASAISGQAINIDGGNATVNF